MITCQSEQLVYANPFITVHFDAVRFPSGAEGHYTRIRSGSAHPGVVILPVRDGQVGLVRQFRYPLGASMWELPRGGGLSEDTAAEARRELREETGAEDAELVSLGRMHPDSGILETEVHLFLARLADDTPFAAVDEVDDALWVPISELLEMVADGDITDGFTLAAICRANLRGLLTVDTTTTTTTTTAGQALVTA